MGADVEQRDDDGFTPLLRAAARGDASLVNAMLEHGADVHALAPRMGLSALHLSAQSGSGAVAAALLAYGAFVDLQSPVLGNTALMDAVLYRSDEVARVLLDHGARTFIRNHWNQSALELARDEPRLDVARWIEERNRADAEALQATALLPAVGADRRDEVRRRLDAGASVDERAPVTGRVDDDYTALGIAARDGRVDLVETLLAAGADPRRTNGLMGGTAVHEAAYFGHADVITAIVASGARPDRPSPELDNQGAYNGLTALHDAVWHGHEATARALVRAGARVDIRTHAGLTPRDLAVRYGYGALAAYLAEAEERRPPSPHPDDTALRGHPLTADIRPHPFAFPQSALDDLYERLSRTRWPDRETVDDWSQGAPLARMQALVDYWRDEYDWRAAERRLNALDPSMTTIDGVDIHFLHLRSPEPDAKPLIMTHGWPGSVFEFLKVAPLLADPRAHGADPSDAYHLVLPSLPGFGLSGKPTETGWGPERIGAAWLELMRRLRYDRFVAQGGDWGYAVTNALAAIGSPELEAVHFNMFPTFETMHARDDVEERAMQRRREFLDNESGYQIEQIQSPQTIGYALTDSPVGQAAWLYEKYEQWTDHNGDPETLIRRDEMLDNITLYWLTGTAASSARIYWESMRTFEDLPVDVPVGYSQFPRDIYRTSRRWVEERYPTLAYYNEMPKGGHFAAWEQPELFAEEVRRSFRASL